MIGGNVEAVLQHKSAAMANEIGEQVYAWADEWRLRGWLDLSNGDSKYTYGAKLQESTHVFVCDYVPISREAGEARLMVNGAPYEVLLIDNPMELGEQLEIYLKFVG